MYALPEILYSKAASADVVSRLKKQMLAVLPVLNKPQRK